MVVAAAAMAAVVVGVEYSEYPMALRYPMVSVEYSEYPTTLRYPMVKLNLSLLSVFDFAFSAFWVRSPSIRLHRDTTRCIANRTCCIATRRVASK